MQKIAAVIKAVLQVIIICSSAYAGSAPHSTFVDESNSLLLAENELALNSPEGHTNTVFPYAAELSQASSILTAEKPKDRLRSVAVGSASSQFQQWLNQYGTAQIQLDVDRHGDWGHSSGDVLFPLYENDPLLHFIQAGMRKPSGRLTGNLGYGVRSFWKSGWMVGGNTFYDNDFTGSNRRIGFGAEAWRNYLRLSANTYLGISHWHTSRDLSNSWQEKPADGFDIRAEGWLPAYPQLGAKLVWEQFYGKQVALFDSDHHQKHPYAVAAGVEYTPVPLFTLNASHRKGGAVKDTQLSFGVNWHPGYNLSWHVDPINVNTLRTLVGSRYDLVNRNNEIVLQYRKNPDHAVAYLTMKVITDNSPADGTQRNELQILATNHNGQPVSGAPVEWSAPTDGTVNLTPASAVTDRNGLASVTLSSTIVQVVPVSARSGSASAMQNSHFNTLAVSHIELSVLHDNAPADGISTNTVVATLTDNNGRPVEGSTLDWLVPPGVLINGGDTKSDSNGSLAIELTALKAGSAIINAEKNNLRASTKIHFTVDDSNAAIGALVVTTDGSIADGKAANVAEVSVVDINGNALANQTVNWTSNKAAVHFEQSAATNDSGKTTVRYTSKIAEPLLLTAKLANGRSASIGSVFTACSAQISNMTVTSGARASGTALNTATVTVTDAQGNPVLDKAVMFSVTGNAKLSKQTVLTDKDGQAKVTLSNLVVQTVLVTAKLDNGSSMTRESSFIADLDNINLVLKTTSGAHANGSATNTATIKLKDNSGNPLSGQKVTVSTSGSARLSLDSGMTDENGQLLVTLTNTMAETVIVTATLSNGKTATMESTFISFSVETLTASAKKVKSDGQTQTTLTAIVKDKNDVAVVNTQVVFTVNGSAKLSERTVITNNYGQAQITVTNTVEEIVTVLARANNNSQDAGKSLEIEFVMSSITHIAVSGTSHVFSADSGFPETGHSGAEMIFKIDGSFLHNSEYSWQSDRSWVRFSSEGVAFMDGQFQIPAESERKVTITARPKLGGKPLTYTFLLKKWYKRSAYVTMNEASTRIRSSCLPDGVIESEIELTSGAHSVVGKLFGEWRDSPSLRQKAYFFYDKESIFTWEKKQAISFIYSSGVIGSSLIPGGSYLMCYIPL